jgi:hypothetical protein
MHQSVLSEDIFQLKKDQFISNSFIARHITMINNRFMYSLPHVDALLVQDLLGAGTNPYFNRLDTSWRNQLFWGSCLKLAELIDLQ